MSRKKSLVIVTHVLSENGAERVQSELINEWVRKKTDIYVVQIHAELCKDIRYHMPSEVKVINFYKKGKPASILGYMEYIGDIFVLTKFLRTQKDAVVLSFLGVAQFEAVVSSFMTGNSVVLSERNDPRRQPRNRLGRKMRDFAFYHATKCVFQTEEAMKCFPPAVQAKGTIIPNPINPSLPGRWTGIRTKRIVTAGRLYPQKNFTMLLEAFAMFVQTHSEYSLDIFGRGVLEDQLKRQAESLKIEDKINWRGFSNQLFDDMRDAAMYVCSSDYEGISNSLLEAMGLGIPTISTDCPVGGSRYIIKDGENGLLVPIGDKKSMCGAMCTIADNPQFAESLSQKAYEIVNRFTITDIADQWLNFMFSEDNTNE